MMRRTLFLLLSASSVYTTALKLAADPSPVLDACATVDCASGLVCALAIPQSCNVSPCPKMPTCLPKNQTCDAKSCKADETCVLRSVTCIKAPCYPVRECAKFPKCGANEEYNECSLSGPCEPNCTDSFPICTNVTCGSGACECIPGYFRHNGKCISKEQCPEPTCEKKNEVWNTCPSACPQTCRIFRGKDEQMPCPAVCGVPECTCAVGYVRDDDWNCVKAEDCPKEFKCASPHEEYKECSTHCEPTCDNRTPTCIESCGPAKCQCKPDYVRHEGSCLFALQCPLEGNSTVTPMRPIPADSGSAESEEDNSIEKEVVSCEGVRCKANSACSLKGGRPVCSKCDKNEKVDTCPNVCSEKTCDDDGSTRRCMVAIKMCGIPRCVCEDGLVRDMRSGRCIKKNKCPRGDNSTMHILPFPNEGAVHTMPVTENGTMHIMPIFTGPLIRPAFPDKNRTIIENGTMHIMPHFGNDTIISLPYVPENITMHILPYPNEGVVHTMPVAENGTMHIMPVFNNLTRPLVMPLKPDSNRTFTGPLIRPAFPDNNRTIMENGTMHIMPHFGNGTVQTLPFIPQHDGAVHTMPVAENGTMHILPHFDNRTRPLVMPLIDPRPLIRPAFPDNNRTITENGTMHIMPHFDNGTMISLPYVPTNDNGTMHILPHLPKPLVRPAFPDNNRTFVDPTINIMPVFPGWNGTMHILPFIPTDKGVVIDPLFPRNDSSSVCANHTCPKGQWCEETQVFCFRAPCLPVPTCVSVKKQILPMENNGTMHILPFIPSEGEALVDPVVPRNNSPVSSSSVCANHTCPTDSWCEETPVFCIRAPCPPIPTCVSVKPVEITPARDNAIVCGKNEEHSQCAPRCQETCRGVGGCVEAMVCKAGCVCKDKFKRDGHGVCVPNHKCWKTAGCQDNEVWHKCRPCEPTCTDAHEVCASSCVSGCGCEDGFVRGPKGDCITQENCPKISSNSTVA